MLVDGMTLLNVHVTSLMDTLLLRQEPIYYVFGIKHLQVMNTTKKMNSHGATFPRFETWEDLL